MLKALTMTHARRIVTLNMSAQTGETEGFSPETHLEVLGAHAPDLQVDVVLAARRALESGRNSLQSAAESLGAKLVVAHLGNDQSVPTHDRQRLAAAYHSIFTDTDLNNTDSNDTEGNSAWR
jgi:2-phospho-L-lactate transferase/gluconeogenesis factor (CofD/UPF0052 family)